MTKIATRATGFFDAWKKRRAYRQTVLELRSMPRALARDVNIMPGDIERVARQAVYGA